MCWACFADPAPVTSFHCEVVPKEPTLILKWARPPGTNVGFWLEISRGAWRNVTDLGSCTSENGTEYRTEVTYLNYSTSYNISITASFCNKMASPAQNTCLTSITGGLCGGSGGRGAGGTVVTPGERLPSGSASVAQKSVFLFKFLLKYLFLLA